FAIAEDGREALAFRRPPEIARVRLVRSAVARDVAVVGPISGLASARAAPRSCAGVGERRRVSAGHGGVLGLVPELPRLNTQGAPAVPARVGPSSRLMDAPSCRLFC